MNSFKRKICISLFVVQFCLTLPAHASLGLLVSAAGAPLLGVWAVAIGSTSLSQVAIFPHRYSRSRLRIMEFVGFILLDEQSAKTLKFTPITQRYGFDAGLTEEEREAFNASLEKINLVLEDIAYSLAQLAHLSEEQDEIDMPTLQARGDELWEQYFELFSPSEVSAIKKVREFLSTKTQEKV